MDKYKFLKDTISHQVLENIKPVVTYKKLKEKKEKEAK